MQLLSAHTGSARISTCVVYATEESVSLVNFAFEAVPMPRVFEWNVMHRKSLARCCMDIDGVLCLDPTPQENDDGEAYSMFLTVAGKLCIPSYPVSHLVTSRLEKYRRQTEAWLHQHGIVYSELHMLDLPNAETRRKAGAHAAFKAEVFRRARDTVLFIESDRRQALEIARLAGKPVLCFTTQEMFQPGLSAALIERKGREFSYRLARWLYRPFKRLMSE
jgi:uncharacterized HAD superfamily protein